MNPLSQMRAVTSTDGMTADLYSLNMSFLGATVTRIINVVKGVNRVVYDITSNPPETIEWERGTDCPRNCELRKKKRRVSCALVLGVRPYGSCQVAILSR